MTKVLSTFVLFSSLLLTTTEAQAAASCWPHYNAVNQVISVQPGKTTKVPVLPENQEPDQARTDLKVITKQNNIIFQLQFKKSIGEVGLPQNVYALLILNENGYPLHFEDFTGACQGAGLSFFPGQSLEVFNLKLNSSYPKKLKVILWSQ